MKLSKFIAAIAMLFVLFGVTLEATAGSFSAGRSFSSARSFSTSRRFSSSSRSYSTPSSSFFSKPKVTPAPAPAPKVVQKNVTVVHQTTNVVNHSAPASSGFGTGFFSSLTGSFAGNALYNWWHDDDEKKEQEVAHEVPQQPAPQEVVPVEQQPKEEGAAK
jgi:hypothetical protein